MTRAPSMPPPHAAAIALSVAMVSCACGHLAREPAVAPPPVSDRLVPLPSATDPGLAAGAVAHTVRGLELLAEGHASAAVTELRLALAYDPGSAFLHERLSSAWSAAGDPERARAVLDRGLATSPDAPGLNLAAGELASTERRWPAAEAHLEKALAEDALLPRAAPALVDAIAWRGDRARADRRARELAARGPGDAALVLGLAGALEDHGSSSAALELYRRARAQRPSDEGATFGEVRLLVEAGRPGEAADAMLPLVELYPDEAAYVIEETRLLRRAGRPEAAAYHREALRATEGSPVGRLQLAAADLAHGDGAPGLELLRDTVGAWPGFVDARAFLAEVLLERDDPSGCVAALAPVRGASAPLRRLRAECLAASGALERAVAELETTVRLGSVRDELAAASTILARWAPDEESATELRRELVDGLGGALDPGDATVAEIVMLDYFGHREALDLARSRERASGDDLDAVLRWADLASRYGDVADAVDRLDALLRRDPQNPVLLNALGFILADAPLRLDEAEVWLRRAHRLAPEQAFIADSLGWALLRRGNAAEAVRLLESADRSRPADPEILRHLGDALEALGRVADARDCWARALAAKPPLPARAVLRRRLERSPT